MIFLEFIIIMEWWKWKMILYGFILLLNFALRVQAKESKLRYFENEAFKLHYSKNYLKTYGK